MSHVKPSAMRDMNADEIRARVAELREDPESVEF